MKRKKWLILAALLVAIFASAITARAEQDAYRIFGGKAGDNAAWELDSHGVLVITGAGEIKPNQYYDYRDHHVNKAIIEPGVTGIGMDTFSRCTMREITIPDTVTSIGGSAFVWCKNVEELVIPDSVTSIGWYAFRGMTGLKRVQLSANITRIEPYTFDRCESLATIVIPEGVTYIGKEAFAGCTNLRAIVLPKSLESIDEKAFMDCSNLWHIIYTGTEEQWSDIQVASSFNDSFFNAAVHYNCTGREIAQTVTEESTCTAKGKLKLTCSVCDATKTIAIGKCPHEYQYACHGLCVNCGSTEGADHRWNVGIITKQPTCKDEGIKTFTCKYCGEIREEVEEKSEWHTYDNKCDNECNICGHTRDRSHKWDEGTVTKEPTCGEEGLTTYTCTTCEGTKTEPIEKLTTHTYDHGCDTDCNICGEMRTTSHVPGDPATETTDQVCTECGVVLTPATGPAPTEPTQPNATTTPTEPTDPAEQKGTQPTTGTSDPTDPVTDPVEDDTSDFAIVVILIIGAAIGAGVLLIVLRKKN